MIKLLKRIKPKTLKGLSLYNLLQMYSTGIVKGAVTYRASAISFSFFMAIFPFLLFVLNLIPYIPLDNFQADFLGFLESLLPPKTADFFAGIFEDIASKRRGELLSTVFILSIFLMANGINAIFGGFKISYHIKITRNLVKQYFAALGVAILMAFLLLLTVVAFIYFEVYIVQNLNDYGYIDSDETGIMFAKYLFFILIIYIATSILFFFGTVGVTKKRFFSPGALLTTILILVTTYLFGIYIENFSQYNQVYGSIGALLILMFYIWINSNLLLLGFELNASINSIKNSV